MSSQTLIKNSKFIQDKIRKNLPKFKVGSMLSVHYQYIEGDKKRTQVFKGLVTNLHNLKDTSDPKSLEGSFTMIRDSVNAIKIERTFPINSPFIEKIVVEGVSQENKIVRAKKASLRKWSYTQKDINLQTTKVKIMNSKIKKIKKVAEETNTEDQKPQKKTVEVEAVAKE
jgi:large subunit ribosomal protein L19